MSETASRPAVRKGMGDPRWPDRNGLLFSKVYTRKRIIHAELLVTRVTGWGLSSTNRSWNGAYMLDSVFMQALAPIADLLSLPAAWPLLNEGDRGPMPGPLLGRWGLASLESRWPSRPSKENTTTAALSGATFRLCAPWR